MALLQYLGLHLAILVLCSHIQFPFIDSFKLDHQEISIQYTYDRIHEIQDKCGPLLSSRSKLAPDDTRGWRVKEELPFANGDWFQEPGAATLMPFQDCERGCASRGNMNILNLASFWVVDVDPVHRMRDTVSISGVLDLGTGREVLHTSGFYMQRTPEFYMQPGQSRLRLIFEGVYAESDGERLMCLLGTGRLPTIKQSSLNSPMEPMQSCGEMCDDQARGLNPSLILQDDQIMLVLKYPKALTLTGRVIRGEMMSLNDRSDVRYFDRINISSQLVGSGLKYQFGARQLLKGACDPYPYPDKSMTKEEELVLFKGDSFCYDLQQFVSNGVFNFVPRKIYNGAADKDQHLYVHHGLSIDFDRLRLLIQDFRCHSIYDHGEMTANVSAVFRLSHSWEDLEMSNYRTGLHGTPALSAEGTWRSSSGQLCMAACIIEAATSTIDHCNYRICLYVPHTFSLAHRSLVFGTISEIHERKGHRLQYHSLVRFEMPDSRLISLKDHLNGPNRSYEYSTILEARSLQKQRNPTMLEMLLRKSIFTYPIMNGGDSASLSRLLEELAIDDFLVPVDHGGIILDILSLGPLFSWNQPSELNIENFRQKNYLEEGIPIAGYLSIFNCLDVENMSLAFEGLYNPTLGRASLVGCRDVRTFHAVLTADAVFSLQGGKDCLIEAEVDYPPNNFGWLINPKLKISITSKRLNQDPLHFSPLNLRLLRIGFRDRSNHLSSWEKPERAFRIFLLSLSVACIFSQLNYRAGARSSSFVSLSMLGLEATGYFVPLIWGSEVRFEWAQSQPFSGQHLQNSRGFKFALFSHLDSAIRTLLLVAFLLTVRIFQKVHHSRQRCQNSKSLHFHQSIPDQENRIPDEKKVLLTMLIFHLVGFLVFSITGDKLSRQVLMIHEEQSFDSKSNNQIQEPLHWLYWLGNVDGYASLVQDFFLLPHVFSNIWWKIEGKPLRKLYYMGLTTVRVIDHVYVFLRDPISYDRHGRTVYYDSKFDVYMNSWNIIMAVALVGMAVIVYFQQQPKKGKDGDVNSLILKQL